MNLAQLIAAHKGQRSYADLERDCGGTPKAARWQQLATAPPKNFPDPPTIEALARGLKVPAVTVVLSSAESLGIDTRRAAPEFLDYLPEGIETLTEQQVQIVSETVRSFVESNRRIGSIKEAHLSEWGRAIENRGGIPAGPFSLVVWDRENDMVYTAAEAEEFGIPLSGKEDASPEVYVRAAEIMKARVRENLTVLEDDDANVHLPQGSTGTEPN